MIKILNYLFQSIIIYSFFFIGKIMGINISRKIFSSLFFFIAPIFKSKKIINSNLDIFSKRDSSINKEKIIADMWKNYGKTFIEYIFLNRLRKESSHIIFKGEKNLIQSVQNGKPSIFISGHFANFELMSMEITKKKYSFSHYL